MFHARSVLVSVIWNATIDGYMKDAEVDFVPELFNEKTNRDALGPR